MEVVHPLCALCFCKFCYHISVYVYVRESICFTFRSLKPLSCPLHRRTKGNSSHTDAWKWQNNFQWLYWFFGQMTSAAYGKNKYLTVFMFNCSSKRNILRESHYYSRTNTLTPQLLWLLYLANGNLCWKWFPDSMYLITLVHTGPYSICTLWGRFVSADGSPLSGMRFKAVLEIKTSSSDFKICYSPKHKFITFPQYLSVVWSDSFNTFFQISRRLKCCKLCQNLDIFIHRILFFFFLITCCLPSPCFHPICLCFSCPRQSELLHRVTCTCQSCIVRIQHIPLAWQTWFTWSRCSLTSDERGLNNSPFSFYCPEQTNTADQPNVYVTVKLKKIVTLEHR